jgi:hypothetical protein
MRHRILTAVASAVIAGILFGTSVAGAQPLPVGNSSQPDGQASGASGPAAQWPSAAGGTANTPSSMTTPETEASAEFVCNRLWRSCQYEPSPWDHPNSDFDERFPIFFGR